MPSSLVLVGQCPCRMAWRAWAKPSARAATRHVSGRRPRTRAPALHGNSMTCLSVSMTRNETPIEHTVPIGLVSQLVRVVKLWEVSASDLLPYAGLTEEALGNPFERVPVATMCTLLARARTLTGEPGLGYYLGLQKRATLYGCLVFAGLSA